MPPNYEPPECCGWSLTHAEGYFLLWHQGLINLMYWLSLTQGHILNTSPWFSQGGQWETTCFPTLKIVSSHSTFKSSSMLQHNIWDTIPEVNLLIMQVESLQFLQVMCLENKCASKLMWFHFFLLNSKCPGFTFELHTEHVRYVWLCLVSSERIFLDPYASCFHIDTPHITTWMVPCCWVICPAEKATWKKSY